MCCKNTEIWATGNSCSVGGFVDSIGCQRLQSDKQDKVHTCSLSANTLISVPFTAFHSGWVVQGASSAAIVCMAEAGLITALWRICFLKLGPFASLLWWYTCLQSFNLLAYSLNYLHLFRSLKLGWICRAFPSSVSFLPQCLWYVPASTCALNLLHTSLHRKGSYLWSLLLDLSSGSDGERRDCVITDGNHCYILISFLQADGESLLSSLSRSLLLCGRNKAGRIQESLFHCSSKPCAFFSVCLFYFETKQSGFCKGKHCREILPQYNFIR